MKTRICPVPARTLSGFAVVPLVLAAAWPAWAQTQLKEVVVSANRSEQLLTDALPHTTVIGRDAIERSQAVDLPALLATEAGFQFTQNGGRGSAGNMFLRGSASRQVLVLVDGVPLTKQDTTGTVSLEHMMLDQIERVEVVRGNVSAIYGSGAIGGVIQVFTRQGQGQPLGFAQLEAGSFNTVRAAAGVSGKVGDTRFAIGVGGYNTRGFSAMDVSQFPNENPDADGYSNSNYNLALSNELSQGQTLGLRAQGNQARTNFDGGGFGTPSDLYKGRNSMQTWSLYSHNQMTRDWRSELTFSQGRENSVYDARATVFPYDSQALSRSSTLNWTNAVALDAWLITVGAERQLQYIDATDSSATQLDKERGVTALFAGLSGAIDAHSMQFNLRSDAASGLPSKTTGYAGYGYQLTPAWKLIATASTAFNLPPLGYLYDPFSGNPLLQPETARSAEIGLQWVQYGQMVRATAFRTRTDNLMQYDFTTFSFNNVSDSSNQGVELSYSGKLDRADLRASLTVQDPVDEGTGQRLLRRADTLAALSAWLPVGAWTLGAELSYTGDRPDLPGLPVLPAYTLAKITARYALTPELALTARIENLADQKYQTAYGYNQSGRAGYVGMVWTQK